MGIDLSQGYSDIIRHLGHKIVAVAYGPEPHCNAAIECETCNEVLIDFDNDDRKELKYYDVEVIRNSWRSKVIRVRATSQAEAGVAATAEAGNHDFGGEKDADYDVNNVSEVEGITEEEIP